MKKIYFLGLTLLSGFTAISQCQTAGFSGLESDYSCPTTSTLFGSPAGGTFSGPGVTLDTFDPAAAGLGTHVISYTTSPSAPIGGYSMVEGLPNNPYVGTSNLLTLGDDELSIPIPIGFNFTYFGNTYSQLLVSSNGFITFNLAETNSGCCSGPVLPSTFNPMNTIAVGWNDLNPTEGGTISYALTGTAPNQVMVIMYNGVAHFGSGGTPITAQIMLYETTNVVEIHVTNSISDGDDHTVGMQNSTGTCAFTATGANGDFDANLTNTMIQFTPSGAAYYNHMTGLTNAPYTGPLTSFTLGDDVFTPTLPIGFTFDFYGSNYTDFRVSSNGFITFDQVTTNNGCCAGLTIPTNDGVNNMIAFAWNDLNTAYGGTMGYATIGTAPNRVLIMDFNAVGHHGGPATPITTQVKLYETSGIIEIHSTQNVTDGSAQTMGIENAAGTEGIAPAGRNSSSTFAVNNEMTIFYPYYTAIETTTVSSLTDVTAPVPYSMSLPDVTSECSVDFLDDQFAEDNCEGFIVGTNNAVFPITTNTVVTWSYDDGNGNISTQTQNVLVDDVTPPTLPGLTVTIAYGDSYLDESTWTLLDAGMMQIASGGPYGSGMTGEIADVVTIPAGAVGPFTFNAETQGSFGDNVMDYEISCGGTVVASGTVAANSTGTETNIAECDPLGEIVSCEPITTLDPITADDNCAGSITGTNDAVFPITTTTVVNWSFDDGNGNIATAMQTITIEDMAAPVPDEATLADITETCEMTDPIAPTATDDCMGTIDGTPDVSFPITSSTTVVWTYTDGVGNTTTQTQNINISPLAVSATQAAGVLTATSNAPIGVTYQWVDCDNGNQPITNETNSTFTPSVTGNYAVVATYLSCSETSACQSVTVNGITELSASQVNIYPNPAKDVINIQTTVEGTATLYDFSGKEVRTMKVTKGTNAIQLNGLAMGTYTLRLISDVGTYTKAIVVSNK